MFTANAPRHYLHRIIFSTATLSYAFSVRNLQTNLDVVFMDGTIVLREAGPSFSGYRAKDSNLELRITITGVGVWKEDHFDWIVDWSCCEYLRVRPCFALVGAASCSKWGASGVTTRFGGRNSVVCSARAHTLLPGPAF